MIRSTTHAKPGCAFPTRNAEREPSNVHRPADPPVSARSGSHGLNLPGGDYRLTAVADTDSDALFPEKEVIAVRRPR